MSPILYFINSHGEGEGGLSTTQLIKAGVHTAGKIAHTCLNVDYEDNTKRKDSSTLKREKCAGKYVQIVHNNAQLNCWEI